MTELFINGRFRGRAITGVERYATEIEARMTTPHCVIGPGRPRSGFAGHGWEQCVLPGRLPADALLWSPCNFGPLSRGQQVVTIHDAAPFDHPEWFSRQYRTIAKRLIPPVARRAVRVITVSEFSKERIVACMGVDPARVTVIGNGAAFRTRPSAPETASNNEYFLSVASPEPRKNLSRLLAGYAAYRDRTAEPYPLILVGGAAPGIFAGSAAADSPGVVRAGRVDDDVLAGLYAHARAVVYVALYEGFGLPPVEAIGYGTPVIASDIPPIREACGGAATYVSPLDLEEIATALGDVSPAPAAPERAMAANVIAFREAHSWERSAARHDALFAELGVAPLNEAQG